MFFIKPFFCLFFLGINGKVYIFYGGKDFPLNTATESPLCGPLSPCPEKVVSTLHVKVCC